MDSGALHILQMTGRTVLFTAETAAAAAGGEEGGASLSNVNLSCVTLVHLSVKAEFSFCLSRQFLCVAAVSVGR